MSDNSSKQAYAYTPGLKVKRVMRTTKERKLPIPGEVLVERNAEVEHNTIVAKAYIEGDAHVLNGANLIKCDREDVVDFLVKEEGDSIKENEVLLAYRAFFGLIKKDITSPVDGIVESVSTTTGQIIIREPQKPLQLDAYVPGKIKEIFPSEGVMIETQAALVQGIFGFGGEAHGNLKIVVKSPEDIFTEDCISVENKGQVAVGGSMVTLEALNKGVEIGLSGIITGGIEPDDLTKFMGEEIGVAITGQECLGLTLIVTEGFGKMIMSHRTFNLLKDFDGNLAHINGATQIRAGVMRPEIIIPHDMTFSPASSDDLTEGMVPGTLVRIIRQPYFGEIGKVVGLPVELMRVESESLVRVVEIELENGIKVKVPRANVEIIEE